MLRLLSRTTIRIGQGYNVHVLSDQDSVWVRLGDASTGKLLRFWSRATPGTSPEDIAGLIQQLRLAIAAAAPEARANHSAIDIWPKGWEFWPGVPRPIRDQLADPSFQAQLQASGEQVAILDGAIHSS